MTVPENATGHSAPAQCENCHTPLQGEYCHQCGQSIHNPVRHAGHALEEVFESFWHLDGRVFRTLRDLLVPGRTALEYLAGHRQRYLPPLRIFVIMSLLAFFVGRATIHFDDEPVNANLDVTPILEAQTVEEVKRNRDEILAQLHAAQKKSVLPGVDAALIAAQVKIEGEAANRIVELTPGKDGTAAPATFKESKQPGRSKGELFSTDNEAWNPETNPVKINWLPDFVNGWLTRKVDHALDNIKLMENRPDRYFQAFMSSLPSALFVLVPVFALMLKISYFFQRRLYMEHLVIALYSHVYLLMALTTIFLLMALGGAVSTHAYWLSIVFYSAVALLLIWMPLYLLVMQKRVYKQGWIMTLLKYSVIGFIYVYLLAIVAALMFLVRLANS
ncbi:DUF3667 domain-containing protein [Pseudoxanthomonas sacheonensis]|uniref:DUF3667 domain-containing protein n=1 Tax=Pseudoxanthomonas sacheonensis TaxID=443615 RepID=UPI0013D56B1F|nr:DUF3667 domain-containing protein [Pseudoxanthomonas sacheonensis]KAF1709500.1 hypothetical protein CSC73_06090 [Pseudoxanthomonas sacheonensis]